jgi:hypothetical protein
MSATTISQLAGYKGWSFGAAMRPVQKAVRNPWRSFRRRLVQKPGSTLAMTAATAFACTIMTNALALQTERHPSPMFTSLTGPAAKTEAAETAVPVPPARPAADRPRSDAIAAVARDGRPRKDEPQRTASVSGSAKDQMLAIIADSAADKGVSAAAPANPDTARIASIQKALNKAGFGPLKEDGAFGAGTRRALERFEADRKLVVRGEPNGKVLKELAKATGIAIN